MSSSEQLVGEDGEVTKACSICNGIFGSAEKRVKYKEFLGHEGCVRNASMAVKNQVLALITRLERRYTFPWLVRADIESARGVKAVHRLVEKLYLRLNEEAVVFEELDSVLVKLQELSETKLLLPLAGPKVVRADARKIRRRSRKAQMFHLQQLAL